MWSRPGPLGRVLRVAPTTTGEHHKNDLVTRSNTTYADDFIFNWVIDSGQALECIQAGETGSPLSGSQRSPDQHDQDSHSAGSPGQAQNALAKYLVTLQDGTYMRFQVQDRKVDLRVVHSHVYLGAQIGYRKFEQATVQHRIQLAKSQYARLRPIIRCQAVPCRLRLQLWKACIPPCLLHGLDSTGFPPIPCLNPPKVGK